MSAAASELQVAVSDGRAGDPLGASLDAAGAGRSRRPDLAALGYAIAALAVAFGWIVTRRYVLVDPLYGLGYWLGIIGASLMAVLLLYPVRKRVRLLRVLGPTKYWFRMHMIFGVAGPVLILYHCNFSPGSLNSTVALVCTLLVTVSGLVGRYLYTKVFSDLDGHRRSLTDLVARAQIGQAQRRHVTVLAPELLERMRTFDAVVLEQPESFWGSVLLPMKLGVTTRIGQWRLSRYARRHIASQARKSPVIRKRRRELRRAVDRFIAQHLRRVRRVAELASYERLFSLWHVFHLPFFYMLILTALIHVLAVHMY